MPEGGVKPLLGTPNIGTPPTLPEPKSLLCSTVSQSNLYSSTYNMSGKAPITIPGVSSIAIRKFRRTAAKITSDYQARMQTLCQVLTDEMAAEFLTYHSPGKSPKVIQATQEPVSSPEVVSDDEQ